MSVLKVQSSELVHFRFAASILPVPPETLGREGKEGEDGAVCETGSRCKGREHVCVFELNR